MCLHGFNAQVSRCKVEATIQHRSTIFANFSSSEAKDSPAPVQTMVCKQPPLSPRKRHPNPYPDDDVRSPIMYTARTELQFHLQCEYVQATAGAS